MVKLIFLGISLEIVAAVLGTISKQMIACTERVRQSGAKRCTLGLGLILNIVIGPLVDGSAYFFAPQTVIAPFASLDVIFNAISAPRTLGWQQEKFTWKHFAAAFLVSAGASSSAYFGSAPNEIQQQVTAEQLKRDFLQPRALVYFVAEAVVVLLAVFTIRSQGEGRLQGMLLGGVAGLLMGNIFLLKGFVSLFGSALENDDWDSFLTVTPYALLAGALAGSALGTYFMQWGLRRYKGVYMVTIFEGMHISCGCASGDIILQEMAASSWQQWLAYWASVGCIIGGIVLINYVSQHVELGSERMASFTHRLPAIVSFSTGKGSRGSSILVDGSLTLGGCG